MTENKHGIGSDLAKVDAYENRPEDYDEVPELTDVFFDRAEHRVGDVVVKRGRPAPNGAKQQITLRLDPAVIDGFKQTGPGWQARMNEALRAWLAAQAA